MYRGLVGSEMCIRDSSGSVWHGEFQNNKKNGESYWELASISPIKDKRGRITHFIAVKEDITERKRKEQKLKEINLKLKEMDVIKSNFISMVSHEIRTPLTSIKAFAEILLTNPDINSKERKEFLEIINTESDRLTRLINDVLDLSKIESGKMEWHIGRMDLSEVIKGSINEMKELANKKRLTLKMKMNDSSLINGDKDRLHQVMVNLIGNAIKFTPEGGEIVVEYKNFKETGLVQVSVSDTGIGMAKEHHEKIFEQFTQISSAQRGRPGGTGLGLAICKEIIEHHGGKIWVESETGKGSTFIFTLPLVG